MIQEDQELDEAELKRIEEEKVCTVLLIARVVFITSFFHGCC